MGPFGDGLVYDGLEVGLGSRVGEAVAEGLTGADWRPRPKGPFDVSSMRGCTPSHRFWCLLGVPVVTATWSRSSGSTRNSNIVDGFCLLLSVLVLMCYDGGIAAFMGGSHGW